MPTPVPPQTTRPTPPGSSRPTPPAPGGQSRPTPPRPEPGVTMGSDMMAFMTRTLDRDRNGTLEDNEARVAGSVGNRNGFNGTQETARALNEGNAFLYAFQFARDAAEAIANRLSGGDAWVSREDFEISDAARNRLDVNNDNRVSREELTVGLQRGGLAINAKQIATSDEAKARFERPAPPPPSGNRPTPPRPDNNRPTPPRPDVDRPAPPRPDRPSPPPVASRTPNEIVQRAQQLFQELQRTYQSTSMSSADRDQQANRIVEQAVDALLNETRYAGFQPRKAALQAIYQGSGMSAARRDEVEARLIRDAVEDVGNASYPNWNAAKQAVQAIYQGSSMSAADRDQLEARLLNKEIEKIVYGSFPSFGDRRRALDALYQSSSMSAGQRDEIAQRIEREEINRPRPF